MTHPSATMYSMGGWNPWAELRGRTDIEFGIGPLPGERDAMTVNYPGQPVIALRPGLSQVERRRAMAHELIHLERGTYCQSVDRQLLSREEAEVENVLTDRLVPPDELRVFWVRAEMLDEHVLPHQVAEHFDVPEDVAERAMQRLLEEMM